MRFSVAMVFVSLVFADGLHATEVKPRAPGFDCVITPSQTVELGSTVPGLLSNVLVDRNSEVVAGQIVAQLDSRLEQATLEIAALHAQTDTELSFRMAAFEIDQRIQARMSSLAASDVASSQEKDRASRDAKTAAWRVLQAEESMEVYKLERARAQVSVDRRQIRSPIDGVVLARMHNPGEYVDSQPILRIVKLNPLNVEAILPMRLFGKISSGMRAIVFSELEESSALEAVIDVVDPMGDASSGTFGARLLLQNPTGDIPAGVKCRVQVLIDGMASTE